MAHLKKSDITGHLMKGSGGHLVKDCTGAPETCNDCSPAIPDTLYVTCEGLSGDFAPWEGKTTLAWLSGCWWADVVDIDTYPRMYLYYLSGGPYWMVRINTVAIGCQKTWDTSADGPHTCDPWNGTYAEVDCGDTACSDHSSCEDSAGATCVVSTT